MVKLIERSQAPSRGMSHTRLIKAQAKTASSQVRAVERSPARTKALPVYRADLILPCRMQNMEKLPSWATLFVVAPTVRQGSRRSVEKTEEAKAGV